MCILDHIMKSPQISGWKNDIFFINAKTKANWPDTISGLNVDALHSRKLTWHHRHFRILLFLMCAWLLRGPQHCYSNDISKPTRVQTLCNNPIQKSHSLFTVPCVLILQVWLCARKRDSSSDTSNMVDTLSHQSSLPRRILCKWRACAFVCTTLLRHLTNGELLG